MHTNWGAGACSYGLQGFIQKFWLGVGERDEVHAGGRGVLCDIPRQKKRARIAIEGPDLSAVNFDEVLDIFKEKNRRIRL